MEASILSGTAAQGRRERKPTAMKILKRVLPIVLAVCLLASLGAVSAIDAGETRTVIGADLTDDQIKTVYKTFGIERGSVKELTVTNQDERQYLSGVISDAQIGTKAISCISIEVLAAGKGMTVNTSHITYCTSQMYISALATAGIMDAKISVAAPFDVSGTAALTGIYKAYEDITGTKLDETAKAVSSQELATTAELAQAIGDYDSVEIVNELKLILNETKDMTDAELRAKIKEIAAEYNVTLTDDQMTQLVNLCRSLEKLDTNALLSKVQGHAQAARRRQGQGRVLHREGQGRHHRHRRFLRPCHRPLPQVTPDIKNPPAGSACRSGLPKARAALLHRPLRSMLFLFLPAAFSGAFRAPFCATFLPVARLLPARVGFCTRLKHGFVPFRKIFAEHRRIASGTISPSPLRTHQCEF